MEGVSNIILDELTIGSPCNIVKVAKKCIDQYDLDETHISMDGRLIMLSKIDALGPREFEKTMTGMIDLTKAISDKVDLHKSKVARIIEEAPSTEIIEMSKYSEMSDDDLFKICGLSNS